MTFGHRRRRPERHGGTGLVQEGRCRHVQHLGEARQIARRRTGGSRAQGLAPGLNERRKAASMSAVTLLLLWAPPEGPVFGTSG